MLSFWSIQVKKVGFRHIIVASFNHMTRLGDTFCRQLKEQGEDFSTFYAFTELIESVDKDKVPDTETIPIGLKKMKEFGIINALIEMDVVYSGINYEKFKTDAINKLLSDRMRWIHKNLSKDSRIFINLRDFPEGMLKKPERIFQVVHYLSSLPPNERPFGLIYEEPTGKSMPQELAVWTAAVRKEMEACGWKDAKLLVHVHEQWGLADSTALECLANGADGIWASLIKEGAAIGHASSCVTIMNLVRLGNKKVLQQFNCTYLRKAAQEITRITTGIEPHSTQVVYGERALDMVLGIPNFLPEDQEFDVAKFFGEKPAMRITTLATPKMITERLKHLFGEDPQFTEERGQRMKEVMLEDLHGNRKEEYMSAVGLAMLFDRSGGQLTAKMSDMIAEDVPKEAHAQKLIAEIRAMWDEWDLREESKGDDELEFDSFYNGFMAPYFGCYRCDDTRRALKAIDMDEDGKVDWKEFALYLKWAIRQYPETTTAEELLSIAFRKGLIPAMQDVVVKQKSAVRNEGAKPGEQDAGGHSLGGRKNTSKNCKIV